MFFRRKKKKQEPTQTKAGLEGFYDFLKEKQRELSELVDAVEATVYEELNLEGAEAMLAAHLTKYISDVDAIKATIGEESNIHGKLDERYNYEYPNFRGLIIYFNDLRDRNPDLSEEIMRKELRKFIIVYVLAPHRRLINSVIKKEIKNRFSGLIGRVKVDEFLTMNYYK